MNMKSWMWGAAMACLLANTPNVAFGAEASADNKRPAVEKRNFTSHAVEDLIAKVSK